MNAFSSGTAKSKQMFRRIVYDCEFEQCNSWCWATRQSEPKLVICF
jgi:hypothetical protein